MSTRKKYIENILESMHTVKHKIFMHGFIKNLKNNKDNITSSQLDVLGVIRKKRNLSVTDVAKAIGISNSAATQLIEELVNKGYVTRESGIADRRTLLLNLSEKSKRQIDLMKEKSIEWLADIFECLSDRELAQYSVINKKISDSILNKKG